MCLQRLVRGVCLAFFRPPSRRLLQGFHIEYAAIRRIPAASKPTVIDLHAHYLHSLEDGPESLEDAIGLARSAVADGITRSIMTPCIAPGRHNNDRRRIEMAVERLRIVLDRLGIPLEISIGAVVQISADSIYMVAQEEVPFIGAYGEYDILLLEFPDDEIPPGSINLIQWMMAKQIRPLIAHPERNGEVKRDINSILPFLKEGCLVQLSAASLTGEYGDASRDIACRMLEYDWVFALATESGYDAGRLPGLTAGRDAAAEVIGMEKATRLVERNPAALLVPAEES